MTAIDEVDLVRRQIERLRSRGTELKSSPEGQVGQIKAWIRDVCETVRLYAGTGSYLNQEADKLWRAVGKPSSFERGQDLLNALEWRMTIDDRYAISEDFRRAVNIAIKDQYFQSWPYKVIVAVGTAVAILIIGGTLYSGIQVNGLIRDVGNQQKLLQEASAQIDLKSREFNSKIGETRLELDEMVRVALAANNSKIAEVFERAQSETNAYVTSSKEKLNDKQTEIVQKLDRDVSDKVQRSLGAFSKALEKNAAVVSGRWDATDKKLTDDLAAAKRSLENATSAGMAAVGKEKDEAIKRLSATEVAAQGDLKAPVTAVNDAKNEAVTAVKSAFVSAKNEIDTFKAETEGSRNGAVRSIQGSTEKFERDVEVARTKMTEAIKRLPNDIVQIRATMSSIDSALGRYRIDLATVVGRLRGDDEKTRLGLVVDLLGVSFWLIVGSVGVSLVALLIAAYTIWSRPRPSAAVIPDKV